VVERGIDEILVAIRIIRGSDPRIIRIATKISSSSSRITFHDSLRLADRAYKLNSAVHLSKL